MKKAFLLVLILFISVISTACINNFAVQELNNKAKGYLEKEDYENAINRLEASIDLDNTIFETHYNLGIAYTQAEKYPQAVETFKNAIKLKPNFADAYYSLAVAQENFAKGIINNSIEVDGKLVEQKDENPDETLEIGKKNELSDDKKAKISELLEESIKSYEFYLQKGVEIKDKQDVEDKIEYLKTQLLKYSPQPQEVKQ